MPDIQLVEVSPRDGLQNEPTILAVADKIALVERAIAAGARRIEVASFVNPARVPQMADAEAVIAGLPRNSGATYIGLVLNKRGVLRALETAVDEIGLVCIASDTFGMKNQGQTSDESLDMACDGLRFAREQGRSAQATIAVAWGCPFEGPTDPDRVVAMARQLADAGSHEVALADTIGIAKPYQVEQLVIRVREAIGDVPVRVHLHDTRGMGVANGLAAISAGATVLDASIGGTGGCPFAPGSAGNVATEDLAYAINGGLGLDLDRLVDSAVWLNQRLGRMRTSAVTRTMRPAG
ncbi:MAG TPA: hydroxymethylglutaryl-CoA lyase [Sphingomonas sp.]